MERSRREFLADVGKGMLVASVGSTLAADLGLSTALADSRPEAISFGTLEPLVGLMQETPIDRVLPLLVERMNGGTDLRTLVAAGALANARSFGGEDYIGFHAFMALAPAYHMSRELPKERAALPVLKVLYRNCNQIQAKGGKANEVLHPVSPEGSAESADAMRAAVLKLDVDAAERNFAAIAAKSPEFAFNALQAIVEDDTDVHRVVLAYRSYALLDLTGREHAHTTLRQTVRYCVNSEKGRKSRGAADPGIRALLPKLLDQYHLTDRAPGSRKADDAWLAKTSEFLLTASPDQAAEAIAAALSDGMSIDSIGQCLAMTSNLQVLRDPGRTQAHPGKPIGSVHGDSVGVHSSDSMNAWWNIAKVSNHRNALSSMVVGAYHVAVGRYQTNHWSYSLDAQLEEAKKVEAGKLLAEADAAIRAQDQARAAALVQRYGDLGRPERPVFDLLLKYATSEDGALHAEKYYRTVSEEFRRASAAFRWRQLVGLARVTASEYGKRADGYEEACRLLKV
jgi:hypothetical protein